jgi:hypothetical protein
MLTQIWKYTATAILAGLLIGCGESLPPEPPEDPTKLTREKAKALILGSDKLEDILQTKRSIGYSAFQIVEKCFREKGLTPKKEWGVTNKGQNAGLTEASGGTRPHISFTPVGGYDGIDIEVTGIKLAPLPSESAEYKIAVFSLSIANPESKEVYDCISPDGSQALLVLYDDGWRVESLSY